MASRGSRASIGRVRDLLAIDSLGGYAERAVRIPVGAALVARRRLIDGLGSIERAPASLAQGLNGHLHDASTQIERTVGTCLKDGASLAGQLQKRVLRRR